MVNAHQLSREIREPGSQASLSDDPPAFMVFPVTAARRAVRIYHRSGAKAALSYLNNSKVGDWTDSPNPSLASNARNTIAGLELYIAEDIADKRPLRELDRKTVISLSSGPVEVRLDAVLDDIDGVAGRVVLWDGPDFAEKDAAAIAAVFGEALEKAFPGETATSIAIWQVRRGHTIEIPVTRAKRHLNRAAKVRSSLPS